MKKHLKDPLYQFMLGSVVVLVLLAPLVFFLSTAKPRPKPTVLFRKQGAIVSCELKGNDNCGRTLKCSDGTTVYCATNIEVVE